LLFGLQFLIWMSYRHSRDGNRSNSAPKAESELSAGHNVTI
jgi:hypothetical protein